MICTAFIHPWDDYIESMANVMYLRLQECYETNWSSYVDSRYGCNNISLFETIEFERLILKLAEEQNILDVDRFAAQVWESLDKVVFAEARMLIESKLEEHSISPFLEMRGDHYE